MTRPPARRWRLCDAPDSWTDLRPARTPSEAVEALLAAAAGDRFDVILPASELRVIDGAVRVPDLGTLPLRRTAAVQLARIAAHVGSMPHRDDDERNRGLAAQPQLVRVRLDECVRAIVSTRFVPIDDALIFPQVRAAIDAMGLRRRLAARTWATGSMSLVRLTLPRDAIAVRRGDWIEPGVEVRNSEIGASAFVIAPIVFRLSCGNTAIAMQSPGALHLRHVGSPHRFARDFRKDLGRALHFARQHIREWAEAARAGDALPGWREPTGLYDDVNALTQAAQARTSIAARTASEARAHELLHATIVGHAR